MADTAELDDFTGTSGQDLTARTGWGTSALFGTSCEIKTSNDCGGITGADSNANTWNTILSGADGEVWVLVSVKPSTDDDFIIMGRLTTQAGGTVDGYGLDIYTRAGTDEWSILELLNGNFDVTPLGTGTSEVAVNDEVLFSFVGSTLTGKLNGTTVVSATDATYGAAGYLGIFMWSNVTRFTSFGGGVLASLTAAQMLPSLAELSASAMIGRRYV